jgi:DNA-binding NarL/FixJ family response regulator
VFLLPLLHPTHHAEQQWAAHTVKFHVNRILNKLDVSDRTQVVIVAVKRGIVCL